MVNEIPRASALGGRTESLFMLYFAVGDGFGLAGVELPSCTTAQNVNVEHENFWRALEDDFRTLFSGGLGSGGMALAIL